MMTKLPLDQDNLNDTSWEFKIKRLLNPFEEFLYRQTTSGILLMVTAVFALWLPILGEYALET